MGQIRSVRWLPDRTSARGVPDARETSATGGGRVRRGLAPLVLVVAGIVVWQMLGPQLSRDHDVALDLGAAAASIASVELTWTDPRATGTAESPAVTTRWNFEAGNAPSRLHTHVRVADGEWQADVDIARNDRSAHARWSRRVYLEGSQVVLALREALQ